MLNSWTRQAIPAVAFVVLVGALASCSPSKRAGLSAAQRAACASSAPGGLLTAACDAATPAVTLTGAGASSVSPLFTAAFYTYNRANNAVRVNYSPAGSGVGVTDIQQGTVQFGDSEIPMAVPASGSGGSILQAPVDLGGVAVSYNVPGAPAGLKLDGPTLAGMFLGTITAWNAPAIRALNPGVRLPGLGVVPVHRADSSGPGYDLDQYLIDTGGPAWTAKAGATANTHWPVAGVGVGQQLNTGVAGYIGQTQGAVGYVEYAYALQGGLRTAALRNGAGVFVAPSEESIAAAGAAATGLSPADFNVVNAAGAGAYPLANFNWVLLYRRQADMHQGIALGKLFDWLTTAGQAAAGTLGYAPLPANAVALAHRTLSTLETAAGQPIF